MKSYFAKLAARATLANVPVSRPTSAGNSHDPFEETGVQPGISSLVGNAQQNVSVPAPVRRVISESPAEVNRPRTLETDTAEIRAREPSRISAPTTAEVVHPKQARQPSSDTPITNERRETVKQSRAGSRASEQREPESTRLSPLIDQSPAALPISRKEKDKPESSSVFAQRLNEIGGEQKALLRRADAFMAGLFASRERSVAREAPEQREERQTELARTEPTRDPAPRLQPVARPPRVTEPVDDEPSVVIGKLSVEILPSPAPPVPQRQIVVVRGGARRAASQVPSSQRFGFSRF
jgi:hypothetical protein